MKSLNKVKPQIEEINGLRCVIVEQNIDESRADFLTRLLLHNGYAVEKSVDAEGIITLGVTDLLFNPVIDVYKRRLRSFTGHKVTPAYWLQLSDTETIDEVQYWKKSSMEG